MKGANPSAMAVQESRKTLFLMVAEKSTSWPPTLSMETIIRKRRKQSIVYQLFIKDQAAPIASKVFSDMSVKSFSKDSFWSCDAEIPITCQCERMSGNKIITLFNIYAILSY